MKFSFSIYTVLTSAAVVAAATAPSSAEAIDLLKLVRLPKEPLRFDEPSPETEEEDPDSFRQPEMDGKRRHLTSSEEQRTPPPRPPTSEPTASAPTCPQRRLTDDGHHHRHLTSSEDGPPPTEDPCATEPPVPSPTNAPPPVAAPTPLSNSGSCDYSMTKPIRLKPNKDTTCKEISELKWKKLDKKCRKRRIRNRCPGLCDVEKCGCYNNHKLRWEGGRRTLSCSVIAKYDAARLATACKKPRTKQFCRGVCNPSCPVEL